jgi:hypothetical protein
MVLPVDRDAVYDQLRQYTNDARRRVDLMYFASHPPSFYPMSETKDDFFDGLDTVIDGKSKTIRLIMLYTAENRAWIEFLVGRHRGNPRFSLSIIEEDAQYPLVSTQVFDDGVAILMNLDRSISPNRPRDLVVQSKKVLPIFDSYYQEMYRRATPLVSNGEVENGNLSKYL